MTTVNHQPRLAVLAAILDERGGADKALSTSARLGSDLDRKAEVAIVAEPTDDERALARALRGENRQGLATEHAIAELLLLADEDPAAARLSAGLIQAFLPSGHSTASAAPNKRRPTFADLYRRLALHQLNNQVRNKAAAILRRVGPTGATTG